MPLITILADHLTLAGRARLSGDGELRFRIHPGPLNDDAIVAFKEPLPVKLVAGVGTVTLPVLPTGYAYVVTVAIGGGSYEECVVVEAGSTQYHLLTRVDRSTLQPATLPSAWAVEATSLDGRLDTIETALPLKAPLASPALTGTPTAPTATAGTATTQLATTAFVGTAVTNLVDAAPGALDTLNELAAALGDDANYAATVTAALAGKQPLDSDLTAIAALVPANDDLVQRKAGAWTNRTPAQVKTDLAIAAGDVSGLAAAASAAAPVQSVAGRTGAVVLAVADVTSAVATTDPRLSDTRTPTDATVTNAKLSAVDLSAVADSAASGGRLALTTAERGTVAKSAQRHEYWVDPRDYGALGDDTHDDTTALNAALAALPNKKGITARIAPGTYRTTGDGIAITGRSDFTIHGQGAWIRFDSVVGGTDAAAVNITDCHRFRIDDLYVDIVNQAARHSGIAVHNSTDGHLSDNIVRNSRQCGITVYDVTANTSANFTITGNTVEYCRFGIYSNAKNSRISDNHVADYWLSSAEAVAGAWTSGSSYYDGIILGAGTTNTTINGNTIVEHGQSGIYTGPGCTYTTVVGNTIVGCQNKGIDLDQAVAATVAGNTVIDCATGGIHLYKSTQAAVSGNTVLITTSAINQPGILLNSDCTAVSVVGNTVHSAAPTAAGIFLNGSAPKTTGCTVGLNNVTAAVQFNMNTTDNSLVNPGSPATWGATTTSSLTSGKVTVDLSAASGFTGRDGLKLIPSADNTYFQVTSDYVVRLVTSGGTPQALTAGIITGTDATLSGVVYLSDTATLRLPRAATNNAGYLYFDATANAVVFRDSTARRSETHAAAAPTTGTWIAGDIAWNTAPAAGGFAGWICTTGGTPGTWKPFAIVAGPTTAIPAVAVQSGSYYSTPNITTTTTTPGEGTVRACPIKVAADCTVDQLLVSVTGAGSAGAVLRIGVYADDGTGAGPGTLIVDAGTVDGTATGIKTATVSMALNAGQIVWLATAAQAAATTRPTLRGVNPAVTPTFGSTAATDVLDSTLTGVQATTTQSGAFPSTLSWFKTAGTIPKVAIRIA